MSSHREVLTPGASSEDLSSCRPSPVGGVAEDGGRGPAAKAPAGVSPAVVVPAHEAGQVGLELAISAVAEPAEGVGAGHIGGGELPDRAHALEPAHVEGVHADQLPWRLGLQVRLGGPRLDQLAGVAGEQARAPGLDQLETTEAAATEMETLPAEGLG